MHDSKPPVRTRDEPFEFIEADLDAVHGARLDRLLEELLGRIPGPDSPPGHEGRARQDGRAGG